MRLLLILLAVTCAVSLLYAVQYYAGGPIRLPVAVEAKSLAFEPGSSRLAAAASDGTVRLWQTDQDWAMRILRGHSGPVLSVAFAPDGTTLVSAGRDGTVRVWDTATGQLKATLDDKSGPLNGASLAADGSLYATIGDDGIVRIWDLAAGQVIQRIGPGENTNQVVALSADGSLVAAGDSPNIQVWNARTGELVSSLEGYWKDAETEETWVGHNKKVTALAFSPDGAILASGAADATCLLWDLETSKVKWTADGHWAAVVRLVFSPDGKTVLSGSSDNKIRSFRIPGGTFIAVYQGHLSSVNGLAFGPTPDILFSDADDGTVRQWETANQKVTRIEWTGRGFQPAWGKTLAAWALISGLLGMVALWGLWRVKRWGHLLALALYLLGPIVVLGLPLLESFPFYYLGVALRALTYPLAVLLALLSSLVPPISILGSLICFVLVLIWLCREEGTLRVLAGLVVVGILAGAVFALAVMFNSGLWRIGPALLILAYLFAFTWGWLNSTRLRIDKIMLVWTVMLISTLLLFAVMLFLSAPLYAVVARPGVRFVLGDPSTIPSDYSPLTRLLISAPLLVLAVWYGGLVVFLMREGVVQRYQAADSLPLAQWLMVSRRTNQARLGIFGAAVWIFILVLLYSILRRFDLDVAFMGHWFRFVLEGAGVTFYISAASIVLAVVLALFGALGHLSKNPIANGVSSFYISLIRGTPLLVQIYIWYLGLPRLDIVLPATLAGILALGVNYGAYMSEIFRAGIQAIGKGQHEAAHALGMSQAQTFRRIVLPQAFRIVIPPIGNEFIAMMKDSALVSVMAVWELSYRAQKVGRQYFRSLETFIVAAAFYWILTVLFQFLQGKLETYMARSERR